MAKKPAKKRATCSKCKKPVGGAYRNTCTCYSGFLVQVKKPEVAPFVPPPAHDEVDTHV